MRPMSLLESRESSGEISLKDLFSGNKELVGKSDIDASKLAFLACRGGWPMSVKLTGLSALLQARDYVDSVAESELSLADNTRRDEYRLRQFLRSYARLVGSQAGAPQIQRDISANAEVSDKTVYEYLRVLKRDFCYRGRSGLESEPSLKSGYSFCGYKIFRRPFYWGCFFGTWT